MRKWRIEDSEELYNITGWGTSYFGINDKGHVVVTPRRDGVAVDLKELVDELQLRDVAGRVNSLMEDPATGEGYVLIVNESGMVEKRVIETGLEGDFYVEVSGGDLKEGERVILNAGTLMISEGMTVVVD